MDTAQIDEFIEICESFTITMEGYKFDNFLENIEKFFITLLNKIKSLYSRLVNKTMVDSSRIDKFILYLRGIKNCLDNDVINTRNLVYKYPKPSKEDKNLQKTSVEQTENKLKGLVTQLDALDEPNNPNAKYRFCTKDDLDYIYKMTSYYSKIVKDLENVSNERNSNILRSIINTIMSLSTKTTAVFIKMQFVNKNNHWNRKQQ